MTESIDSPDNVECLEIDTTEGAPAVQLVELVADLEGADPAELAPVYDCIDHMIADIFSSPPPGEADAELEFSYQGYRVHVRQDGIVTVRPGR